MSEDRKIELDVEVVGSPEAVWQAIASGPGITSWYVPHAFDEREGAQGTASFGEGPEMQVPFRVAAWEPPHRLKLDGGEGVPGLAFEWLIEAREGGSCVVRLVNTGFGDGAEWDEQYDGMEKGWRIFLANLQLHCRHFAGQAAVPMQPLGMWPGDPDAAWTSLTSALGLPAVSEVGSRVTFAPFDDLRLSGTVTASGPTFVVLLLEEPAPGTGFVIAEGGHGGCGISVWAYLYGPDAAAVAERDKPRWQGWLEKACSRQ